MSESLLNVLIAWGPVLLILGAVIWGAGHYKSVYKEYLNEHKRITEEANKENIRQITRIADALETLVGNKNG